MTQGFYEQLGVPADADTETVRTAYHRQVSKLSKRMKQLREQGGDIVQLELARTQLEEAWEVLRVPARRQRYDAMLRFLESDAGALDADGLWDRVGSELVPPALAAATRLIARTTKLKVHPIGVDDASKEIPRPRVVHEAPTSPTVVPSETAVTDITDGGRVAAELGRFPAAAASAERPSAIQLPRPRPVVKLEAPSPALKVVEGRAAGKSVIVLPADAPRQKTLDLDEVGALTDRHGFSGALLRAVREAKGVTLQEVADTTRISVRYLQAIEADAHDRLPSATFVKGYVREVAKLLKLDDEAVVAGYMRRLQG